MAGLPNKPLGIKNYGHIPRSPGSRIGPGDQRRLRALELAAS
jgi:hypothetical protein